MKQVLLVNGKNQTVEVDPETPLLFVLADELHLNGPRFGCGMAQCGACTVMIGSQVVRSCVKPVGTHRGAGLKPAVAHPLLQGVVA